MNKILLIILLLNSSNLLAQRNKNIPPPPPSSKKTSNKNTHYKELSLEKRLNKFPFKEATKIEIISFNLESSRIDELPKLILRDSLIEDKNEKANIDYISLEDLITQNKLDRIYQRKTLTLSSINKLSDILFNTCSKYNFTSIVKLGCYNPRNGIIFFNEFGEIYEYLEICFECNEIRTKSNKIEEFCTYVYSELNKFFIKNGIETSNRNER